MNLIYDNLFDVPQWSLVNNPFYQYDRGSQHTLITVGDSWTWGDSLGKTKVRNQIDDEAYRLKHVYGNIVSEQLGYNWANLALPGASNARVLNWLFRYLDRLINEDVTCVITLTESGRHEELRFVDYTRTQQQTLEIILDHTYDRIAIMQAKFPSIKFIVAHNFTDSRPSTIPILEKSWLEVLLNKQIQKDTHIVVSEHIEQMNYDRWYADVAEIVDRANDRIDLLDSCDYCNTGDTRHPNEQGHNLWANYLLTQL